VASLRALELSLHQAQGLPGRKNRLAILLSISDLSILWLRGLRREVKDDVLLHQTCLRFANTINPANIEALKRVN